MSEPSPRNIILTGIPRSGTTLLTALIDGLPDAVALNEPKWQYDWAAGNRAATAKDFASWLVKDFALTRQKLLHNVAIPERRRADGTAVTNYYEENILTQTVENTFQIVPFTRAGLSQDFTLAMKHNGLYLGTLQEIIDTNAFTVLAIIRHPAGVLSSWNKMPIPPAEGKLPGAALYWPQIHHLAQQSTDLLEKQVRLYDLMCRRLYELRQSLHIVFYEKLLDDPGLLYHYTGVTGEMASGLLERDRKPISEEYKQIISKVFEKYSEYTHYFYPQL